MGIPKKKKQNIKKIKKQHSIVISSQIGLGKAEEVRKTIIVPIIPTLLSIENSKKNSKKFKKLKKTPFYLHFKPNRVRQSRESEQKKNYRSDPSYPTKNREFQKKIGKSSKN